MTLKVKVKPQNKLYVKKRMNNIGKSYKTAEIHILNKVIEIKHKNKIIVSLNFN